MVDNVIIEGTISVIDPLNQPVELHQRVPVNLIQLAVGHLIGIRVKASEVPENKAGGISNLTVTLRKLL